MIEMTHLPQQKCVLEQREDFSSDEGEITLYFSSLQ